MPDAAPRNPNPTPDAPPPPEIPDYSLLRRIGRGSYGDVWLARSVTGVFRVIKVVQRARFQDDRPYRRELEGISRFQAAVSGLPRQLALLHVGRNDAAGYFYYVMEPADDAETGSAIDPDRYVPLTLREMLKRRGRLPASECIQFVLELARGLAVLHGVGLIHRDIKPSNIILVQRVPKLADVGLVASIDATLTGVGTPGYLPPEGPGSPAADIYSLGKVLYEIATGLDQSQFPRIPRELAEHPDAPLLREINGVILKACNRFPSERHPSAEAVARDLEIIQAGRSIVLYEEFRKRSRAILIATATFATLAACAAALFVWRAQVLERANHQSRLALYQSDISIAQLAKASGDLGRARNALARQVPVDDQQDYRGLEWSILSYAVQGEGAPLEPISNRVAISKLAVDPSGRWLAAALIDDRVGVWDLQSGQIARIIDDARVLGGFLPDGRIVVDEPNRAIRYEQPQGEALSRLDTKQRLYRLLPSGKMLVVTPDGDLIYRLIDPEGASDSPEFNLSTLGKQLVNSGQDVSPDGTQLTVGAYSDNGAMRDRVLINIDLRTGEEIWRLNPHARIVWIQWAPNGQVISANIGGLTTYLIDPKDGSVLRILTGHSARVHDAAFSADGRYIATASADQTLRVWDVSTGNPVSTHRGLGRPASSVAWLPDGKSLAASDDTGSVQIFPFPNQNKPDFVSGLFDDLHGDLAFTPDAQLVAVTQSTNKIALVSVKESVVLKSIEGLFQPVTFGESGIELFAFSADWSLWRHNLGTDSRESTGLALPSGFSVDSWALDRTGSRFLFSGNDGEVVFFDLRARKSVQMKEPEKNRVWALAFDDENDEIWAGSEGGNIHRWRAEDGTYQGILSSIEDADFQAFAVSNDGRWLAASLFNDSSLRIWDCRRKTWLPTRFGHRRFIQSLVFTPKGDRLISGGVDGRVIMWRVPGFEEIASFEVTQPEQPRGDEGIASLRLAPSDAAIAALTEDGRLQIWRAK